MIKLEENTLALIINGPVDENLGRVVMVNGFIGEHTSMTGTTKQDCWSVSTGRKADPLKGFDGETGEIRHYRRGIVPSEWLMPIAEINNSEATMQKAIGKFNHG